jgi:hypothetical protein
MHARVSVDRSCCLCRKRDAMRSRDVVPTHRNDIHRLKKRSIATIATATNDGVKRELGGLRVVAYNIPEGCVAGYHAAMQSAACRLASGREGHDACGEIASGFASKIDLIAHFSLSLTKIRNLIFTLVGLQI